MAHRIKIQRDPLETSKVFRSQIYFHVEAARLHLPVNHEVQTSRKLRASMIRN